MYNIHFCLIWKTNGFSFEKAIEELKTIFKSVDNIISIQNVDKYFRYQFKREKISIKYSYSIRFRNL